MPYIFFYGSKTPNELKKKYNIKSSIIKVKLYYHIRIFIGYSRIRDRSPATIYPTHNPNDYTNGYIIYVDDKSLKKIDKDEGYVPRRNISDNSYIREQISNKYFKNINEDNSENDINIPDNISTYMKICTGKQKTKDSTGYIESKEPLKNKEYLDAVCETIIESTYNNNNKIKLIIKSIDKDYNIVIIRNYYYIKKKDCIFYKL